MRKIFPKFVMLLVLMIYMLVFACHAFAGEKVIRVGYDGIRINLASGMSNYGYKYDAYQKLSDYTGWKYEYVYGTLDEILKKLETGEVDMCVDLVYTEDRAKNVFYSSVPQGVAQYYIMASADNDKFYNMGDLPGKKIGVLRSSFSENLIREYLANNNIASEVVPYDTYEGILKDIKTGKLDAICTFPNTVIGNHYVNLKFISQPLSSNTMYIVVSRKRPELYQELETALHKINEYEPHLLESIHDRYVSDKSDLPPETKNWLDTHKVLRVGYMDYAKLYIDSGRDGDMLGFMGDIIENVASKYNLALEPREFSDTDELFEALAEDEIDIVAPVISNSYLSDTYHFATTGPIITGSYRMFYVKDFSQEKPKVAINKNNMMKRCVVEFAYPDAEFVECDSLQASMDAVKRGEADCAFVSDSYYEYDMQFHPEYYEEMKFLSFASIPFDTAFGVKKGEVGLLTLLNHELRMLPPGFVQKSMVDNYQYHHSINVKSLISRYSKEIAITAVFLALMIGSFFALYIVNSRRRQRCLEQARDEAERANMEAHQYLARIAALNDIYFTSLYININEDTYEAIKLAPWMMGVIPSKGNYAELGALLVASYVHRSAKLSTFQQLSRATITKMLRIDKNTPPIRSYYYDYQVVHDGVDMWVRATVSSVDYNDDGTPHNVLLMFQDINQDKELALSDSLTGIYNRIYGENLINEYLTSEKFKGAIFAVMDIDNFKQVNDNFGHQKGDEVLCMMAKKMSEVLAENSVNCRIGGDEFAVFIQTEDAHKTAECLNKLREQMNISISDEEHTAMISLSIGIAEAPEYGRSFAELYTHADKALYYSKEHGKNRITFYSRDIG